MQFPFHVSFQIYSIVVPGIFLSFLICSASVDVPLFDNWYYLFVLLLYYFLIAPERDMSNLVVYPKNKIWLWQSFLIYLCFIFYYFCSCFIITSFIFFVFTLLFFVKSSIECLIYWCWVSSFLIWVCRAINFPFIFPFHFNYIS